MNKTLETILDYTRAGYFIGEGIYQAKKEGDLELVKLIKKWSKFYGTDEEFTKKYITN